MTNADRTPQWIADQSHPCQSWLCPLVAIWRVRAGYYCNEHAIRAGWLPGVAQRLEERFGELWGTR